MKIKEKPRPLFPFISVREASRLPWIQALGISHDRMRLWALQHSFQIVDMTREGSKYQMLQTTELWLADFFKSQGLIDSKQYENICQSKSK